nr:LytR C-terminal domain-containing protein [Herpetosiphonaceae bacterium]
NRGYTITTASTAFDVYDVTTIIDYGDNKQAREQLAALLGIKAKNIILASRAPEQPTDPTSDLVVLIGRDYQEAWREP